MGQSEKFSTLSLKIRSHPFPSSSSPNPKPMLHSTISNSQNHDFPPTMNNPNHMKVSNAPSSSSASSPPNTYYQTNLDMDVTQPLELRQTHTKPTFLYILINNLQNNDYSNNICVQNDINDSQIISDETETLFLKKSPMSSSLSPPRTKSDFIRTGKQPLSSKSLGKGLVTNSSEGNYKQYENLVRLFHLLTQVVTTTA